jgi:hypothetical protein
MPSQNQTGQEKKRKKNPSRNEKMKGVCAGGFGSAAAMITTQKIKG